MKKVLLVLLLVLAILVLFGVFFSKNALNKTPQSEVVEQTTTGPLKGLQLSPKGYFGTGLADFFSVNKELNGTAVGWTGSVSDLAKKSGAPYVVEKSAKKYQFEPIFTVQSYSRETGKLLQKFVDSKQLILDFIDETDAAYFGMGVEVTDLYMKSPVEYEKFVALFAEYAQAIHAQSPNTKVFTTFQYEHLLGMNGGIFGGKNDTSKSLERLFADFPGADIIGITTYPTLIYKDPSEIPSTYYTKLFSMTSKPILFTEMGWMRGNSVKGWEGSVAEQKQFLEAFSHQMKDRRVAGYLWSFLYDQKAAQVPFDSMGLRPANDDEEAASIAESYWKGL